MTIIVISFRECFEYLYQQIKRFEFEKEFSYAVMALLTNEALEYNVDWSKTSNLEDAVNAVISVTKDENFSYEVCRSVSEMIYRTITCHVPDYGNKELNSRMKYYFRNDHEAVLEIYNNTLDLPVDIQKQNWF